MSVIRDRSASQQPAEEPGEPAEHGAEQRDTPRVAQTPTVTEVRAP